MEKKDLLEVSHSAGAGAASDSCHKSMTALRPTLTKLLHVIGSNAMTEPPVGEGGHSCSRERNASDSM